VEDLRGVDVLREAGVDARARSIDGVGDRIGVTSRSSKSSSSSSSPFSSRSDGGGDGLCGSKEANDCLMVVSGGGEDVGVRVAVAVSVAVGVAVGVVVDGRLASLGSASAAGRPAAADGGAFRLTAVR